MQWLLLVPLFAILLVDCDALPPSKIENNSWKRAQIGGRTVEVQTKYFLNMIDARDTCRSMGLQLLTINSAEENQEVVQLMQELGIARVWLSTMEIRGYAKRIWVLIPSRRNANAYNFFQPGEPNDPTENCVEVKMVPGNARNWNDVDCLNWHQFICEKDENFDSYEWKTY